MEQAIGEIIQGRPFDQVRIKRFKAIKIYMMYNQYYCLAEINDVEFLDTKCCVEMADKFAPPYKMSTLLRELHNI